MQYLSDIVEQKQTELFKKYKVFFAFNDQQFLEGIKEHDIPKSDKLASLGAGMYMPSKDVNAFIKEHAALIKDGIKEDQARYTREQILERELANYEIGYSYNGYNDSNFRDAIKDYNFTEEEIKTAYKKHMQEHEY